MLVCISMVVVGCSRTSTQSADSGPAPSPVSNPTPAAPEPQSAWTFKSADHGFSLDLPSAEWKTPPKRRHLEDFWCRTGTGSAMLAGVSSVKKQTREQFDASVAQFRQGEFLRDPQFRVGQSPWGCPYIFADWCERGPAEVQFVYVAAAVVWVADKGIAVDTLFEGQGRMRSKVFQSVECADFEMAANSICTSVR
ncbi:MAG TPA: hypothetical protein VKD90_04790 [Gemmataceae bacterium]|nr:hypothetical protein [Gemmataceae bacterium]